MLRAVVCVSGGGTNLQAILDAVKEGRITNTKIEAVISNNAGAYALTRAKENQIPAVLLSPKEYPDRAGYHAAFMEKMRELSPEHQQKLLITKLLHNRLKVLLLDEPFLYHDAVKKRELGLFLSKLSGQGVIVLIFTSNAQRLADFCDHIYLIDS